MRSRTLEAVSGIERRLRAASRAAASMALEVAGQRRKNRFTFAADVRRFNAASPQSSFTCAVASARRTMLTRAGLELAASQRAADQSARLAREAVIPWAQIRAGLERRRARQAAKPIA